MQTNDMKFRLWNMVLVFALMLGSVAIAPAPVQAQEDGNQLFLPVMIGEKNGKGILDAPSRPLDSSNQADSALNSLQAATLSTIGSTAVSKAVGEHQYWNSGRYQERHPNVTSRLQNYWFAGAGYRPSASQIQSASWQNAHPWSAVFISWVMKEAGAGNQFKYNAAHWRYIADAKRNINNPNKTFWAFDTKTTAPQVSDLICRARPTQNLPRVATFANIDDGHAYTTHCDLVTEVHSNHLIVIGGNTSDHFNGLSKHTVGRKKVSLNGSGFLTTDHFAIVRIVSQANASNWQEVGGLLKQISVGCDGTVWGVTGAETIFRWTGSSWENMPGLLTQVSVGDANNIWGVTSSRTIFRWNGSGWVLQPGLLKQISVGCGGEVWGVTDSTTVFRWDGSNWTLMSGLLNQISVGSAANIWGVTGAGTVWRWLNGGWVPQPGILKNVTAASDGTVWGTTLSDTVWRWDGSAWHHESQHNLKQVSAGSAAHIWAVDSAAQIYVRR